MFTTFDSKSKCINQFTDSPESPYPPTTCYHCKQDEHPIALKEWYRYQDWGYKFGSVNKVDICTNCMQDIGNEMVNNSDQINKEDVIAHTI